jgi:Spy/CpxP family protein refolding chaperone
MKTKPAVVQKLPAIMVATLMIGLLTAFAQPAPGEKPENRPAPQRGAAFSDRIMGPAQRDDFGAYRVLTEEQRVSFREALEAQHDQTRALEEKLRTARKEVVAAGLTEKFDEDAVRQKALEAGKLEAELAVLRAKTLSKIKPPLSAEQIERLKNLPPNSPAGSLPLTPNLKQIPPRSLRSPTGLRDEHNLPLPPKPEK